MKLLNNFKLNRKRIIYNNQNPLKELTKPEFEPRTGHIPADFVDF